MKNEGVEVGSVRPNDGAELWIDAYLTEVLRISQWLKYRSVQLSCEIDIACAAIAEAEPEPVVTEYFDRGYVYEHHGSILG